MNQSYVTRQRRKERQREKQRRRSEMKEAALLANAEKRKSSTPLTIEVEGVGVVVVDVPSTALIDEPLSPTAIIPISVTKPEDVVETNTTTMTMSSVAAPSSSPGLSGVKLLPKVSEEIIEDDEEEEEG